MENLLNHPAPEVMTITASKNVSPRTLKSRTLIERAASEAREFYVQAALRRAAQYGIEVGP